MHAGPVTTRRDASVLDAAQLLGDGNLHALPVVDAAGRLEGMLTSTDLIRKLIDLLGGDR
jgi:CBS domain-containing protein